MTKKYRKIAGLIFLLLFLPACGSSSKSGAPTPTPLSEALILNTLDAAIAGTSAAAQTQTATMRPPTSTPTLTSTPTNTPTVTFTPTPTFFYSLFTLTPDVSPTPLTDAGSITTIILSDGFTLEPIPLEKQSRNNQWRCVVRYTPHPIVKPSQKFHAYWTVVNTGWNVWNSNSVDFVHNGGLQGTGRRIQDIPSTVGYGKTLSMGDDFIAPRKVGDYGSSYVLRVDSSIHTVICRLKMIVTVE